MKNLLAKLGIHLHTWSRWTNTGTPAMVSYPWTQEGCYAFMQQCQTRTCEGCGETQSRTYIVQ